MKTFILLFFLAASAFTKSFCQKKNEIGIVVTLENVSAADTYVKDYVLKKPGSKTYLVPGLSYEKKLSRKSSVEVEFRYKQAITNEFIFPQPENSNFPSYFNTQHYAIKESFLSFPITYKFRSRIINFSVGPTAEYLLDAKQINMNAYSHVLEDEFYSKKWSVGLLTRVSKHIRVYKNIMTEPSVFFNPVLSYKKYYWGIALAVKYQF